VSFRSLLVRLACLGKRKYRVDDRPNLPCIDQGANLDQLISVGFDNKPDCTHTMRLRLFRRGWAGNRDQDSPWFHHHPRSLQGIATHHIKHHIDIVDDLLKARSGIVDDLVGSQFAQEVAIAGRGRPDDSRAIMALRVTDGRREQVLPLADEETPARVTSDGIAYVLRGARLRAVRVADATELWQSAPLRVGPGPERETFAMRCGWRLANRPFSMDTRC
jgi:hypothetical protein